MSRILRMAVPTSIAAVVVAAILPPLAMVGLWAYLSGDAGAYLGELGASGTVAFILSQQRFFSPVVLAGLGAHVVLICLHRFHPLVYMVTFYCIGAVVYMTITVPQLAAFTLNPPVVRTLAFDAFVWWAPAAALSGLIFWAVAARPLRHRAPLLP